MKETRGEWSNAEVTVQFYPILAILQFRCKSSRSLLLIANNTNQHKLTIFYIYIYIVSVYDSWIFFFFSLHLADSPFLPFYPISLSLAFSAYLSVHYVQSTYTCDPQLKSLNTTFRYIIIQKRSHGIYMVVSCAISISISDLNSRVEYYRYDPPCLSKWATIS